MPLSPSRLAPALLAALAFTSAPAQPPADPAASAASAPAPARVARLRAQSLRPGGTVYPVALAEQGVQGTADVIVKIAPDGTAGEVAIQASSRSAALDELALGFVRTLRFNPSAKSTPGAPLPDVILPVEFMRDTVEGLQAKTCAEFNVDAAYFRATFPETDPSHMPVIRLTTGMLLLAGMPRQGGDALVAQAKKLNAAAAGIATACAAAPDTKYLQTFVELVKKAG